MIPVNLIRQYHFCPRIVYFNLLTNIKPVYPRHVNLGEDYHTLQEKLSKNRKFKKLHIDFKEVITDKYLEDKSLNICGKIDLALICDEEIIPLEFKFTESKKPSYSHILQLCGYGLLLSKYYKKDFKRAVISYSNNLKIFKIDIAEKLKSDFFDTIRKIETIVENDILPNSSADENKCSQCEYINYCDDRF